MRLKVVPSSVDCSHHILQAFAPILPISLFSSSSKKHERVPTLSLFTLLHPLVSKNPLKSQTLERTVSRGHTIPRSCILNFEGIYNEEEGHENNSLCAISRDQDSFLNPRFNFLEPMMLGIRTEVPDWPDRETAIRVTIEQKAKSLDIPLSLRMIKKKLQCEEGFLDSKESNDCSVKAAFSSMVFIIVELQSYALHMREALCHEDLEIIIAKVEKERALCHEDLEIIIAKVEKEMHSSFVWLFQQVFSKTPSLMIYVMILLANFSVYSASHDIYTVFGYEDIDSSIAAISVSRSGGNVDGNSTTRGFDQSGSVAEMNLWNSIVDEATKIQEFEAEVVDHDIKQRLVSPVSMEIESDVGYEDYLRTDLLYQMNLSYEPNNPLLLCNYGQFLHLVARDYDRAEACFKRAIQVLPLDAESLVQYANFLWTVRRDFWGAEERFLQSLAADPHNYYYASRYANFLWRTGGEETYFPLNNLHNPNL